MSSPSGQLIVLNLCGSFSSSVAVPSLPIPRRTSVPRSLPRSRPLRSSAPSESSASSTAGPRSCVNSFGPTFGRSRLSHRNLHRLTATPVEGPAPERQQLGTQAFDTPAIVSPQITLCAEDGVRNGATVTERRDSRGQRSRSQHQAFDGQARTQSEPGGLNQLVQHSKHRISFPLRAHPARQHQQAHQACRRFSVPIAGLRTTKARRTVEQRLLQTARFCRITERCSSAVRLHSAQTLHRGHTQGRSDQLRLSATVGCGEACALAIGTHGTGAGVSHSVLPKRCCPNSFAPNVAIGRRIKGFTSSIRRQHARTCKAGCKLRSEHQIDRCGESY
eukprot:2462333-Prymnesium_polylepis.11